MATPPVVSNPAPVARHYAFGEYRVDVANHELRALHGEPISLTRKAFDVMLYLIAHRDRLVGKDELLAAVWPGRVVEENNLTQAISALRHALGTGAGDDRYIRTVPGLGYRFIAEVREDVSAGETDNAPAAPASPRWRRWSISITALLLLIVGGTVFWRGHESVNSTAASTSAPPALAVLRFRSLPSGQPDELLELGLAETLIARLSRSSSLRVLSLASSQRFSGRDAVEAGRLLGAAYVVEGSNQRHGDRVRVNARLLSVHDGSTVWAGTFDQHANRVFTLQDGIAAAVATALSLKLDTSRHSPSACDGADPKAYRDYLTGRYLNHRPDPVRQEQALTAFRRTIDLDPACARAYAGLAFAYRGLANIGDRDPHEMFPLAQAAVDQALRIDPQLAEAHTSQAFIQYWYGWNWTAAETSFQRAIRLNPSLPEAHYGYALLLVNLGRFDEGLRHARHARELDPLSPLINTLEAGFLSAANRPAEARQRLAQAIALAPDYWLAVRQRGDFALEQGDIRAAIADLRRASELAHDNSRSLGALGMAYAIAGDRVQAQAILQQLEARDTAGYINATTLAMVRNALGDHESALDLLERAYRERDVRMTFLKTDARWNNLRAHPRFRALARRMALDAGRPAYGRF